MDKKNTIDLINFVWFFHFIKKKYEKALGYFSTSCLFDILNL